MLRCLALITQNLAHKPMRWDNYLTPVWQTSTRRLRQEKDPQLEGGQKQHRKLGLTDCNAESLCTVLPTS